MVFVLEWMFSGFGLLLGYVDYGCLVLGGFGDMWFLVCSWWLFCYLALCGFWLLLGKFWLDAVVGWTVDLILSLVV